MKHGVKNFTNKDANPDLLQSFDLFGVSDQHLVNIPGQQAKVHPQILASLMRLIERAKIAGFDVQVASGFRSFDRQLMIWNKKVNGLRPVLGEFGQAIDLQSLTDDEKVFAILRWSALPGASRHHWGTDIDVYDSSRMADGYQLQLTVEETEGDGPFAEFHTWLTQDLQKNLQDFFRPYIAGIGSISPEPWHLSYAPLANLFATQLSENSLREKIQSTDIALKESILKNLTNIFDNYIKPYRQQTR